MDIVISVIVGIFIALIIFLLFSQIFFKRLNVEKRVDLYLNEQKVANETDIEKYTRKNVSNRKIKRKTKLSTTLGKAGIKMSEKTFIGAQIIIVLLLIGSSFINNYSIVIAGLLVIAWFVLLNISIKRQTTKRMAKFNKQLPEFITLIISSLKVGHSLTQSIKTGTENATSPIKEEFEIFLKMLNYGVPLSDAFEDIYTRVESEELEILSNAVLIQKEVGGNIIKILEIIHNTIKEREKLQRQIRTLTAQGRLSGVVIGSMPIVILFAVLFIDPEFIMPLFTTTYGRIGLGVGIVLEAIGAIVIKNIVEIEV